VYHHNRLTEWDLIGTHGSTFEQTSPFQMLLKKGIWMRYCQDLLSRDRNAGAYQLMDEEIFIHISLGREKAVVQ
jgi:hypothetical protein